MLLPLKPLYWFGCSLTPFALEPRKTKPQIKNCGTELAGNSGSFSYLWKPTEFALCIWRITTDVDGGVHLFFSRLSVKSNSSWIRVLDGSTCEAEPVVFKLGIEATKPFEVVTRSHTAMVVAYFSEASLSDQMECHFASNS
ncbi:unnamed protein product [Dicrocoelium dendriticum]|nr:unnamed protein product [Dicrocoelium dendriticum]